MSFVADDFVVIFSAKHLEQHVDHVQGLNIICTLLLCIWERWGGTIDSSLVSPVSLGATANFSYRVGDLGSKEQTDKFVSGFIEAHVQPFLQLQRSSSETAC